MVCSRRCQSLSLSCTSRNSLRLLLLLKSWCGWCGNITPFSQLPQSCRSLLCPGALTTPISHLPSLSETGLTTNLWVTPPSSWICAPVKKRINNFWGLWEYPDRACLCDCSPLAGGQHATGLLAVNEQYRNHNKASMGREPALEAAPVILERHQFPPVALSSDSGYLPLQQQDSWRKMGRRTLGRGPPAATGSGCKETEDVSEGWACPPSSPSPCSLQPPWHRQPCGQRCWLGRKDIRDLHFKKGRIKASHFLWHCIK